MCRLFLNICVCAVPPQAYCPPIFTFGIVRSGLFCNTSRIDASILYSLILLFMCALLGKRVFIWSSCNVRLLFYSCLKSVSSGLRSVEIGIWWVQKSILLYEFRIVILLSLRSFPGWASLKNSQLFFCTVLLPILNPVCSSQPLGYPWIVDFCPLLLIG